MKQNQIEEIKRIIDAGYDLELIAFELEIPIEELKQYKLQIEQE